MKNSIHAYAGIDFDTRSLRAVKLTPHKNSDGHLWQMEQCELHGDYTKEPELSKALNEMVHTLGIKRLPTGTTIWGKQAFVTEMSVKRGAEQEVRTAVQFELRKSVPFDLTTAVLEFHEIGQADSNSEMIDIAVGALAQQLFKQHIHTLETADIKPELIDLLPFSICTAAQEQCLETEERGASVILHVGSEVSTLIISDMEVPGSLYHRSIYFSADDIFGKTELGEEEVSRRLMSLVEEISRTLQFYRKNYTSPIIGTLHLCGVYTDQELLASTLAHTELMVQHVLLPSVIQTNLSDMQQGTFAIPCTLALRTAEGGIHG